jgi:hypothetical protein
MKRVHDIVTTRNRRSTVSFIQHGNTDDGYVYELVCPWCATSVHKLSTHPDAEWPEVLNVMKSYQDPHDRVCPNSDSGRLNVERATAPLNTEKLIREE